MPSTMDHVQQLTGSQLDVLCQNYNVAGHHPLHRRHLERRLHVAIVTERAKLRAHHLWYKFNEDQQAYFDNSFTQNEQHGQRDASYNMFFSDYRTVRVDPRHRGGDEQFEIDQAVDEIEDEYVYDYEDPDDLEDDGERTADEGEDFEQQQERQYQQYQQFEYGRQQAFNRNNAMQQQQQLLQTYQHQQQQQQQQYQQQQQQQQQYPQQQQQQQQYQQQQQQLDCARPQIVNESNMQPQKSKPNTSNQYNYQPQISRYFQQHLRQQIHPQPEPQSLLKLMPEQRVSNIAFAPKPSSPTSSDGYFTDSSSSHLTGTEYLTVSSGSTDYESSIGLPADQEHQLQDAERFIKAREPKASSPVYMELEADVSSERELCTVNYLNKDQVLALHNEREQTDDQLMMKLMNRAQLLKDINTIGDRRILGRHAPRHRRPRLWRFILALLSSTARKVASHKVQYTIICCAVVAVSYASIKLVK